MSATVGYHLSHPYCRITVITKYETEKQHIFFSMLNGDPTSIKDPTVGKIEDYEDSYSVPTPKLYEVYFLRGIDFFSLQFIKTFNCTTILHNYHLTVR